MLATALAALVLLFAVQVLFVVKVADKLTGDVDSHNAGHADALPAAGRYAQLA